ncbi:MAG: transketolase C-terminal domain-containing protein [Pseudomonadota bacterium]
MATSSPGKKIFFREAIARALREEMASDERVIVLGQDVGAFGGAYKEFAGLFATFGPERVRDTPVAEAGMIGVAVGAAAAGLRPLVNITYMDFLMLGLDPLVNYAAKARFKTGGRITVPLVVKTTAGAKGQGVAHSQCIEAWMMGVPGLKVVAPYTPADAYGLLKTALRDPGPVLFVDHKRLFPTAGEVPTEEFFIPFGQAGVLREGRHATIAAHSYTTGLALAAAAQLETEGISCEVIDLRSLAPLDIATIAASASRTGVLVTVEEGQLTCGVGAEIAFQVREHCDGSLKVARVGPLRAPVSSNPVLEAACLPGPDAIRDAVHRLLRGRN